jgi:kynurenine formamidase
LPDIFAPSPGVTIDQISRYDDRGPACVIDVTRDVDANADFLLTCERIESWEGQHGGIPRAAWVLLRTGWSKRTGEAFQNIHADGPHGPGFDAAASRMLAKDRDVLGVGVETIGTDAGQAGGFSPPFPNHNIMHGAGKLGLASLCNLDELPGFRQRQTSPIPQAFSAS